MLSMATNDLQQLEQKLDQLLEVCQRLQTENSNLRDREHSLLRERSKLIEKNDLARNRVEAMITRLKNLDVDG